MPRRTTKQEVEQVMSGFFKLAKQRALDNVLKTQQPSRRRKLLNKIDALDLVEAEYYDYINGVESAA